MSVSSKLPSPHCLAWDQVVLGGYYGTGNKGGKISVFLLCVYNEAAKKWQTVRADTIARRFVFLLYPGRLGCMRGLPGVQVRQRL